MQVFGDRSSGNCYKIELFCSILKIDHDWVDIDVLAGDTHKAVFRKLNPNGKIPFVTLHDGNTLAESNVILGFLAEGTRGFLHQGSNAPKHMSGCFSNNTVTNPLSRWRGLFSIIKKCLPNAWRNIKNVMFMGRMR